MTNPTPRVPNVAVEAHKSSFDPKAFLILLVGLALFLAIYFSPPWPNAIDPVGKAFVLSTEGKAAIALFLMAGIWWVFEVLPIGVTAIAIGVFQALFLIRPAKEAFRDFMDPSVMFIFGSIRDRSGLHPFRVEERRRTPSLTTRSNSLPVNSSGMVCR